MLVHLGKVLFIVCGRLYIRQKEEETEEKNGANAIRDQYQFGHCPLTIPIWAWSFNNNINNNTKLCADITATSLLKATFG